MKVKELRELSEQELEKSLADSRQELFNLRCQARLGQIEKRSNIRKVKKSIARAMTLINEKRKKEPAKK